jgi:hypothetical protein
MGSRWAWRFATDVGAASLPNGAAVGFPATNMQLSDVSTITRSDGGDSTDIFTFALTQAENLSFFYVAGHDFLEADTLTFRYASNSGFSADVGTVTPTWHENILVAFFTSVSRQYLRLEVGKAVAAETRQLGRFVSGDHTHFAERLMAGDPKGIGPDTTEIVRTKGGQIYSTLGAALDTMSGRLLVDSTEKLEIETLRKTYGTGVPFLIANDYANNPVTETIYGTFSQPMRAPVPVGSNGLWLYDINMTEAK